MRIYEQNNAWEHNNAYDNFLIAPFAFSFHQVWSRLIVSTTESYATAYPFNMEYLSKHLE